MIDNSKFRYKCHFFVLIDGDYDSHYLYTNNHDKAITFVSHKIQALAIISDFVDIHSIVVEKITIEDRVENDTLDCMKRYDIPSIIK